MAALPLRARKHLPFIATVLLLLLSRTSFGQATPDPNAVARGVYGDAAFIQHIADFRAIPGFPNCCPQFTNGKGVAPDFGIYYQLPLATQFYLYLRAGYVGYGATLTDREQTTVLDPNGLPTAGAFDHTIVASLGSIGIEPMVGYQVLGNLMVRAGGRLGYVITKSFSQQETIAEPANFGVFTDTHTRTRNQFTNQALPNANSIEGDLLVGLSYELPLNASGTFHAIPEAYYSYGLTQITHSLTWRANAVRAGVAIEYTPPSPSIPVDTFAPPPPPKKQVLAASITAVGVMPDGKEYSGVKIKIEEFSSTRLRPLLNYVFFDDSSSAIPDRYTRLTSSQTQNFRVEKLFNSETLPTYYHLLNIVGRRLIESPNSTITLVGCNSDEHKEKNDKALARNRAEHVRDYLRDVWGISEDRMKIEARNLPVKPSFATDSDGIVENRRVEIQSDDWSIIQPVLTNDTVTRVTPGLLRFKSTARADAGVRSWDLTTARDSIPLKNFVGVGQVPQSVDWQLDSTDHVYSPLMTAKDSGSMEYALNVKDEIGQQITTALGTIPIEKVTVRKKRSERVADKEIDHYSLILFDFDKATLTPANQKISEYIREHSPEDATVTITGHTDRMGDDKHNQRLAETRAQQTAKELKLKAESVTGLGKSQLLYDNNLPEGRFYCRTVNIDVERQIKE
jgi:outer membrane protein OmpA-like peptidoglycan-associated protein